VTTNSAAFNTGVTVVLAVSVPLALLLANLYVVANPTHIRNEYGKAGFPPATLYDAAERLELAEATLHYVRSGVDTGYLMSLQSRGRAVYNAREVKHLVDAKTVMRIAFLVQGISSVLSLLALAYAWLNPESRVSALRTVSLGCFTLCALLIGIGLLAYANFGLFFTVFHRLIFEGDSWLFPRTDTLIQLFPVPFWMDATFILAGLTLTECLIVGLGSYALSRRLSGNA